MSHVLTCIYIGPLLGSFYWLRKGRSPTKTWYEATTCWSILIEVGTNVRLNVLIEMRTDRVYILLSILIGGLSSTMWEVQWSYRVGNALLTSALERQHRWSGCETRCLVINFGPGVFSSWLVEGGAWPSRVWHDLTLYHNLQYSLNNQLVC